MKVKEIFNSDKSHHSWAIKCPGCGDYHLFDKRWTFNGNMEKPTFTPSMLSKAPSGDGQPMRVCHSFATNGRINFLSDSTHALAGQTVDLPDIDPLWNEER